MRLGVIGGGFGVDGHLSAVSSMPGVDVAAVADSGSGRVLSRLADPSLYRSSWRDLLDLPIDAVCVVTPPVSHLAIVLELIGRGKHVLCEKPFGMTPTESRAMADVATRAGVVGSVNFQYRFEPGLQALKTLLEDGRIGELRSVECSWLTTGRRDPGLPWTWRNDAAQGGGVIGAFFSHVVDLIHWLCGAHVQEVLARTEILVPRRPLVEGFLASVSAEDQVQANLTLATGVTASCYISNCHPQALGMRIELSGSKGRLLYTHIPPFTAATQEVHLLIDNAEPQRMYCTEGSLEGNAEDTRLHALRGLLERFIQRTMGRAALDLPNFEDGFAVQRVLHATRQSAATQGKVLC